MTSLILTNHYSEVFFGWKVIYELSFILSPLVLFFLSEGSLVTLLSKRNKQRVRSVSET